MRRILFFVTLTILLSFFADHVFPQEDDRLCVDCLRFVVGRPWTIGSPSDWPRRDAADMGAYAFKHPDGSVRVYTANGTTWAGIGSSIGNLTVDFKNPAITRGDNLYFDGDGNWIAYADPISHSFIRAWGHSEGPRVSDRQKSPNEEWSISYFESYDGGITFIKPRYPNNQVIKANFPGRIDGAHGHGNPSIIKHDGYYYLYFGNTDPGGKRPGQWLTSVARSPISSGGLPGTWWKYLDGTWASPGIGGEADKLELYNGNGLSTGFISKYLGFSRPLAALFIANRWKPGVVIAFGDIPTGPFVEIPEPLVPLDDANWIRPQPTELYGYIAALHSAGGNEWDTNFILTYLYIAPGETNVRRYHLRRNVWVTRSPEPVQGPRVLLWLSGYHSSSNQDTWVTTAYTPGYGPAENDLGWLMTAPPKDKEFLELWDCVYGEDGGWPGHVNHRVAPAGMCGTAKKLRTLGWIYRHAQENTEPLYACYDPVLKDHFASLDAACEGSGWRARLLGHIPQGF